MWQKAKSNGRKHLHWTRFWRSVTLSSFPPEIGPKQSCPSCDQGEQMKLSYTKLDCGFIFFRIVDAFGYWLLRISEGVSQTDLEVQWLQVGPFAQSPWKGDIGGGDTVYLRSKRRPWCWKRRANTSWDLTFPDSIGRGTGGTLYLGPGSQRVPKSQRRGARDFLGSQKMFSSIYYLKTSIHFLCMATSFYIVQFVEVIEERKGALRETLHPLKKNCLKGPVFACTVHSYH